MKNDILSSLLNDYPLFAQRLAADKTGVVGAVALYALENGKSAILTAIREQDSGDFVKMLATDPTGVADASVRIDVGHGEPMSSYQIITGAAVEPVDMPSLADIAHYKAEIIGFHA